MAPSRDGVDDDNMIAINNKSEGRRSKKSLWKRLTNTAPKTPKLKGGVGTEINPAGLTKGGGGWSGHISSFLHDGIGGHGDGYAARVPLSAPASPQGEQQQRRWRRQQDQWKQNQPPPLFQAAFGGVSFDMMDPMPARYQRPAASGAKGGGGGHGKSILSTLSVGGETKTCATATTAANTTLNTTVSSIGSFAGGSTAGAAADGATVTTGGTSTAASRRRQRLRELHQGWVAQAVGGDRASQPPAGSPDRQPGRQPQGAAPSRATAAKLSQSPGGSASQSDGEAAVAAAINTSSTGCGSNAFAPSFAPDIPATTGEEAPIEDAAANHAQQGERQIPAATQEAHVAEPPEPTQPWSWWEPALGIAGQQQQHQEQATTADEAEEEDAPKVSPCLLDDDYHENDDGRSLSGEGEDVGAVVVEEVTRVVQVTVPPPPPKQQQLEQQWEQQQEQHQQQHQHQQKQLRPGTGIDETIADPMGGAKLRSSIAKSSRRGFGVGKKMMKNKMGAAAGSGGVMPKRKKTKGGGGGIHSRRYGENIRLGTGVERVGNRKGVSISFQYQDNAATYNSNIANENNSASPQGPQGVDILGGQCHHSGGEGAASSGSGNENSNGKQISAAAAAADVAAAAAFTDVKKDIPPKRYQQQLQRKSLCVAHSPDNSEHQVDHSSIVNKKSDNSGNIKNSKNNHPTSGASAGAHLYAEINIPTTKILHQQRQLKRQLSSTASSRGDDVSLAMTSISSLTGRSSLFAGVAAGGASHADGGFNLATSTFRSALWCHNGGGGVDADALDDAEVDSPEYADHRKGAYFDYGENAEFYWDTENRNGNGVLHVIGRGGSGDDNGNVGNANDEGIIETLMGAWNEAFKSACRCFDMGGVTGSGIIGGVGVGDHAGNKSVANTAATIMMETVNDTAETIANMSKAVTSSHNSNDAAAGGVANNDKGPTFSEPMDMI